MEMAQVYALCKPDGSRVYVGSTLGSLGCRLARHKWRAATNERPHSRVHTLMSQEGPDDFTIELLESVAVADRYPTEARHIRAHGKLNHQVPGRTKAQWYRERRAALDAQAV